MKEISTLELKEFLATNKEVTLLDCRAVDYFHWERIPGAKNLRWKRIPNAPSSELPSRSAPVVTYCQSFHCPASSMGYEALEKLGYKDLYEYSGGIEDWKAHGFEICTTPEYRIAPNVYRFPNQFFYGEPVGSYLIEQNDFVLLIDGPMDLTEENEDFILNFGKPIKILLTHGPTAGDSAKLQKSHKGKIYLHRADVKNRWLTVKPDVLFGDLPDFGKELEVIHLPGHSPGSVGLLDHRNQILFSGDTIAGTTVGEIRNFVKQGDSEDLAARLRSVERLLTLNFNSLYPFHYSPIREKAHKELLKFAKKNQEKL